MAYKLGPHQEQNLRSKVYRSAINQETAHAYHQQALQAQLALRQNPNDLRAQENFASARYQWSQYSERYVRAGEPGNPLDPTQDGAKAIIEKTLDEWGLGKELTGLTLNLIKQGLGQDAIMVQLENSDAYKKRFAGNIARQKAGLSVLSPADYIATETQMKDLMRQYGLPKGLYDTQSSLASMIGNDVSPSELDSRLQVAQTLWQNSGDANVRAFYKKAYGLSDGDVLAGILDPKTALPVLQEREKMAQVGGAALDQGINISGKTALNLAAQGVDYNTAQKGFGQIAGTQADDQAIAKRYGTTFDQNDEINDVLLNQGQAAEKRRQLYAEENSTFSGKAGATGNSLASGGGF